MLVRLNPWRSFDLHGFDKKVTETAIATVNLLDGLIRNFEIGAPCRLGDSYEK